MLTLICAFALSCETSRGHKACQIRQKPGTKNHRINFSGGQLIFCQITRRTRQRPCTFRIHNPAVLNFITFLHGYPFPIKSLLRLDLDGTSFQPEDEIFPHLDVKFLPGIRPVDLENFDETSNRLPPTLSPVQQYTWICFSFTALLFIFYVKMYEKLFTVYRNP